jgi:hypothetical protein
MVALITELNYALITLDMGIDRMARIDFPETLS